MNSSYPEDFFAQNPLTLLTLEKEKRPSLLEGGKDSSLCLHEMQVNKNFEDIEIKALLTTLTEDYSRKAFTAYEEIFC
jgi:hypothetical protein